jgi:hypothetical protein
MDATDATQEEEHGRDVYDSWSILPVLFPYRTTTEAK